MSSQNFNVIHFEMSKLWPQKLCKISLGLYGGSHVGGQCHFAIQYRYRRISEGCISKTFDLNDIKFGRVVKDAIFYNNSKLGLVASNFYDIVFDDVI